MASPPPAVRVVGAVHVHIWLDTSRPLTGRVTAGGDPARPFAGWLQLLAILARALQTNG